MDKKGGNGMGTTMRMPTCEEWGRLVEIAGEEDEVIHWDKISSWCDDVAHKDPVLRTSRGYYSARSWNYYSASCRGVFLGFRPVIDLPSALEPDGSKVPMGTLYMDGKPVRVPRHPTWDGVDIRDYVAGAKLELRSALPDPAYQMVGIKMGSVAIADRVMLSSISWEDIQNATQQRREPVRLPTCEEWDRLVEITSKQNALIHWDQMFSWCDNTVPSHPASWAARGYRSAQCWGHHPASDRHAAVGFRPVIDLPGGPGPDGSTIVMGTLYMDRQPVRVPQRPICNGDITSYIPNAKLELRPDDPTYPMVGVKVGDAVIANCVMLSDISWDDIQTAIAFEQEPAPAKIDMRPPTREEWEAVDADNDKLHWQEMYSWCDGPSLCGFISADHGCDADPACRADSIGFRPVMKAASDSLVMGTLYMGGTPVKIPQQPTWDGDVTDYISGAKLELRPALTDPAYQLMGIRAGDSLVADRAVLKRISWKDIEAAIG